MEATPARPSVRASLLVCATVSLLALWIAAFETPMGELPGLVLFPVLPLTLLSLFACCLWSLFLLTRIRSHGLKFATPLVVCALTLAALAFAPFTQIWLQGNFHLYRADRERIVARVEAGELTPNVSYSQNMIALMPGRPYPPATTSSSITPTLAPTCCF
jgi:hypothetical protein